MSFFIKVMVTKEISTLSTKNRLGLLKFLAGNKKASS